jgi:hypothetical protein
MMPLLPARLECNRYRVTAAGDNRTRINVVGGGWQNCSATVVAQSVNVGVWLTRIGEAAGANLVIVATPGVPGGFP